VNTTKSLKAQIKAARVRETSLEDACVERARASGWEAIKVGQDGWPDRLFIQKSIGRHVWVEFKRPSVGVRSAKQSDTIARLVSYGVTAVFCDSIDQFREVLGC
jgi:hypothetical protein